MIAELLRIHPEKPETDLLRYVAEKLTRGCVVAIPTDTLYGLAADPFNLAAVDEIYRVKGRPEARALPILVNSVEMGAALALDVPRNFYRLAETFWPGALTIVVDASHQVPLKVTANTKRIGLRWPKNEVVRGLIGEFGGPITGTSANLSGYPSCSSAEEVMEQLGKRVPLVLDTGDTRASLPSTIVELHGREWKIGREGAITEAEIDDALGGIGDLVG
ncbi:MAG TPA: L-threonylcarbamoyladenylate synthase [Candidatus Dormibacteraeota bacterium]|nr:L-threonylcarbamoyladenylate synthase [Candidatus Dormibacteraeota bacterium]